MCCILHYQSQGIDFLSLFVIDSMTRTILFLTLHNLSLWLPDELSLHNLLLCFRGHIGRHLVHLLSYTIAITINLFLLAEVRIICFLVTGGGPWRWHHGLPHWMTPSLGKLLYLLVI